MVRPDNISLREKLLDLIQENSGTDPAMSGTVSKTVSLYNPEQYAPDFLPGARGVVPSMPRKSLYQSLISFRKKTTIGIDFGNGYLKAVRFVSTGVQKRVLTAYLTVPNEKKQAEGELRYDSLKSVMKKLCHSLIRTEIWAVIPLENVETRFLTVPMVSEKDLPNAVLWAYKKTKLFDEEENIFDFEYIGEITENGAKRKAVMAYTAPQAEIERVRKIFSETGFPLTGISVYPFAIQNLVRSEYIRAEGQNVCCLFVGMNWSRIDIFFSDGNLAMSSRIQACMTGMMEELRVRMNEYLFSSVPETEELSIEYVRKIFFCLLRSSPDLEILLAEKQLNTSAGEIFEMLLPSIDRLVWRLERIIEKYQTDIGKKEVGKIFVSGEISDCRRIVDYIGTCLDHRIETSDLDPFSCDFVPKNMQVPASAAERGSYVPAVGIALSRNFFTPNFLFTHRDRQKYLNSRRADRFVSIIFALIAILCLGVCFNQEHLLGKREKELGKLRNDYEAGIREHENMVFDREMIRILADRIIERREQARNFAKRYKDIALITAVCELTMPPRIRLTHLKVTGGETKEAEKDSRNKSPENSSELILEGIITAESAVRREALLHDYMAELSTIPIFGETVIRNKKELKQKDASVLHFTLQTPVRTEIRTETKQK